MRVDPCFDDALIELLELLCNQGLDAASRARLSALAGRSLLLQIRLPLGQRELCVQFTQTQLRLSPLAPGAPDCTLAGTVTDLCLLLAGRSGHQARISGDASLLAHCQEVLKQATPDTAALLSPLLGAGAAEELASMLELGIAGGRSLLQAAGASAGAGVRTQAQQRYLNRQAFETTADTLLTVRMQLDRLDARLRLLEAAP